MKKILALFYLGCFALIWLLVELPPRPAYAPQSPAAEAVLAAEGGAPVMQVLYDSGGTS